MPVVSVLMPVKGDCADLPMAIQSVLEQTFTDWELVICKDAIGDVSERYLADLVKRDFRIRVVETVGLNLPTALNVALSECYGEFIARFDSDDVMLPERLSQQVVFLTKNPNYVVCGGQVILIGAKNELFVMPPFYDLRDKDLKRRLYYKCPFAHPAATIRSVALKEVKGYSSRYRFAEDFELWFRLARLGKFANLRTPVIAYRTYASQTSALFRAETKLHMASALVENLGDQKNLTQNGELLVSIENLQMQYLLLDTQKQAIVEKYFGKDSLLPKVLKRSGLMSSISLWARFFSDSLTLIPQKLVHLICRLLVALYSFFSIRPVWKNFVARMNSGSTTYTKLSNWRK